jgi:phospholipid/cholesterol/gamma-HCH transport system ATP-binding protein
VAAELDELILFLKRAFQMTIVIVTHEMTSAFRIADRLAMLYKGSLIAVEDKASFQASTDPRIRQFLDRIPQHIAESESVQRRLREFAGVTGA